MQFFIAYFIYSLSHLTSFKLYKNNSLEEFAYKEKGRLMSRSCYVIHRDRDSKMLSRSVSWRIKMRSAVFISRKVLKLAFR